MKRTFALLWLPLILLGCRSAGQENKPGENNAFTFFSWNVENLFDTKNDTLTEDDDFTPEGMRNWDNYRYYLKIRAVWKTILSAENGRPPGLIALSEIENEEVLRDIFIRSPFGKYNYQYIHRDSPDLRGIDVALVYDADEFTLAGNSFIQPFIVEEGNRPTRDILYACLVKGSDSLHIFVNHWPSKYGGQGFTEPFRLSTALTLRRLTDSIFMRCREAFIICAGDFNDVPGSKAVQLLLKNEKVPPGDSVRLKRVILRYTETEGTIRFQGQWQLIDHFFVSPSLVDGHGALMADSLGVMIYAPGFLLEPDETYGGRKPFRTFNGLRYNGGVSDHLPIMLRIYQGEK